MKKREPDATYEQFGMAYLLPGMVHLLDKMQAMVDEMRDDLAAAQMNGHAPARGGRPPGRKNVSSGWPADPEERSAEAMRRVAVAKLRRASEDAPTHPRDARHPGHAAWREKLKAVQKERWDGLTPKRKKETIQKMLQARKPKKEATS